MLGHGCPIRIRMRVARALAATLAAVCALCICNHCVLARELNVRLRFAWGSGPQAPQKWTGAISATGATLADMQPLGIEPDEAAALRLVDNQIRVAPLAVRAFDGCDVTVAGDETAVITVRLQAASAGEAKELHLPLAELATTQFRGPLDDRGSYLLVNRAPGDRLRVILNRDHLVFAPGEPFRATVQPDVPPDSAELQLVLEAQLRSVGADQVLWESAQSLDAANSAAPVALELSAPAFEGAFRLSLAIRRPAGITGKLTPWQHTAAVVARDVEFVVVDPAARLPRLSDRWEPVQTIEPASSKWWQRVPQWTQLNRLPVLASPRSLGNVKPIVRSAAAGAFVELSTPAPGAEPTWQAYPLAIREVGQPHALEVELPADATQQLAVSIIEPDASGRVLSFGREAGAYIDGGLAPSAAGGAVRHRIVFWPRTATPLVLVANLSNSRPAEYGAIRVSRRVVETAPNADATTAAAPSGRLVAAYVSLPRLTDSLGAPNNSTQPPV